MNTQEKLEAAADEHFKQYRDGAMKSPSLYSDCELAKHCKIPLAKFSREKYIAAYHAVSAQHRWANLQRSHSSNK